MVKNTDALDYRCPLLFLYSCLHYFHKLEGMGGFSEKMLSKMQ